MNQAQATGLAIVCLAGTLVVGLTVALDKVLSRAARALPDVGVDVFAEDCTMLHDCGGCDECGAPMAVDEQAEAFAATARSKAKRRLPCPRCGHSARHYSHYDTRNWCGECPDNCCQPVKVPIHVEGWSIEGRDK